MHIYSYPLGSSCDIVEQDTNAQTFDWIVNEIHNLTCVLRIPSSNQPPI
jgi:hypothetical protein